MFEFQHVFLFIENLDSEICLEGNLYELLCCASCYWCCDIVNITTDGIYILTRLETSHPGNYIDIPTFPVLSCAHRSASNIFIKKTEQMWSYHHCWRGLVFFLSPDTNPVIKCFTFLLTIPHCRQSLSPQLLTKVKGSECLQIETHNSELIITLYSYLESGFWIVIVITSGLKIQNIFHLPSSQLWSSGKMLRQEKYFPSISCEYK